MPLAGFEPEPERGRQPLVRPLSVTELNELARDVLEHEFPEVCVEGALTRITRAQSGHLYFGLQDSTSSLQARMWGSAVRNLSFVPTEGLQVRVTGQVTIYPQRGQFQMVATRMEPAGLGAREAVLRALRERLRAEGVLDAARKRPIPFLPRAIALVTSPDGAALHDLLKVILGRFARARILLVPVRVQGEGAACEIAQGILRAALSPGIDVIIAGRGGGSVEDLWAFNEEPVARALFASGIPVVSAVGHETDTTLADEVADMRAATPSHAGQLVVPVLAEIEAELFSAIQRAAWATRRHVRHDAARVATAGRDLGQSLRKQSGAAAEAVRAAGQLLCARHPGARVASWRQRLDEAGRRLASSLAPRLRSARDRLEARSEKLEALNPTAVLGRGFSLTWVEEGGRRTLLRDSAAVSPGATIRTTAASGDDLVSTVTRKVDRGLG